MNDLLHSFRLGNVIKNGVSVAITGKPNAGKSTLLNTLLNENRAIVSEIAGTTRDTIEEIINIDGILFRLIDTAGLRESSDIIETIGVEKSMEKMKEADLVLQNSRPRLIREEIVAAQQDIDEAQKKLDFIDAGPESKLEMEANQFQLKTLIDSRTAELKMLEAEAASNPARIELLKVELRLLEVRKNELAPLVAAIENLLADRIS